MKWLSDQALDRLRAAADAPDLSGTGYVLLDKLGAGGMGGVFRVEHTALGRQVALKVHWDCGFQRRVRSTTAARSKNYRSA